MGCAATSRRDGALANWARSLNFQVDGDSDLYLPAKAAAAKWSTAIGRTITVTPDGSIPVFFVGELDPVACGPKALGCGYAAPDARIEVLESIPRDQLLVLLLHEMGHQLRGEKGHVTTNPNAIMADPIRGSVITPDDVAFICERFDCAIPASARA